MYIHNGIMQRRSTNVPVTILPTGCIVLRYCFHINNSQKRLLVFTHLFMCVLQWSEIVIQKTWARRNKCSHGDCMWCMPRADWASDTQFQLRLRCLMWNRSNHLPVDSVPVDVSANYQWMWTLHGCMSVPAMATCEWEREWIASKVLFEGHA